MVSLKLEYNGVQYKDMSFIDLKNVEVKGDKSWAFKMLNMPDENGNNYDIEEITFKTNMAKDLYSIKHTKDIKMNKKGEAKLTIHTEKLFNDRSRDIYDENEQHHILQMQFDYTKTRTFR